MSAGWVAATVRARAMTRRRLGRSGARALAASPSVEDAVAALSRSTYGRDVHARSDLTAAQRAVVDTFVWNVRVLSGWTPRSGVAVLSALLAPVEMANVINHLRRLAGQGPGLEVPPPHHLGGLATAWPRIARTTTPAEVREVLATSLWGDPGDETPGEVGLVMAAAAADRIMSEVPSAATWAAGAVALAVARSMTATTTGLTPTARVEVARVLGAPAAEARTLDELREALPRRAAWPLAPTTDPADLWRAEVRWWQRVDRDGAALVRAGRAGPGTVVGTVALLAADAWRVRGALELAARGGRPREALDVVA
jgi:hypothetical protein